MAETCGAGGGRAANGSPAKRAVGLRLRSAWLLAGPELGDPGRAALNFAARPPPSPNFSEARERGGEGARNADHRADANGGARCDHPPGGAAEPAFQTSATTVTPATLPRRLAWAALLQRVFEVDALRCPGCGARMRLVAAIENPAVARKILKCLVLPARAPPLEPAPRSAGLGPETGFDDQEQRTWEFDQTSPDADGTG
jgi:hypothetical protein